MSFANRIDGEIGKPIEKGWTFMDWLLNRHARLSGHSEQNYRTLPELQLPDYNCNKQLWDCTPIPETIDCDAQKSRKLAQYIDIVLLTANDTELKAVLRLLKPLPDQEKVLKSPIDAETYYIGMFGESKTVITKCQMGSMESGSSTFAAYDAHKFWNPRGIIMVGIAFGKNPDKQKIGDVLVASQIISYEPARDCVNEYIPRGSIPPSDPTLLNRFANAVSWKFRLPN